MIFRYCAKCINLSSSVNICTQYFRKSSSSSHVGMQRKYKFDVIIVGGGHAGTEACSSSSRMGAKTLLITHKKSTVGEMSCNPSFGGIGKGHLMKEVDALDGVCSRICDISGVHYKILNKSKGPAVWGFRAQIDRRLYKENLQREIFAIPNLEIIESSVENLILKNCDRGSQLCVGVILSNGEKIYCNGGVVLTTGTFLRGEISIGLDTKPAGRMGDESAIGLAETLHTLGFKLGRLKTGTPPRIVKSSIDYSVCIKQSPDNPPQPFSFMNKKVWIEPENQLPCFLTFTNESVEKIIRDTLHVNKHVNEEISGVRYCPSIESKILKFGSHPHQVWLEPEGFSSPLVYPQGLSCTMPADDQHRLLRTIKGLENCEMEIPGYGVEYDFVNPQELYPSLETKKIPNLFFAGQINGTTGYEEAAAQGLIAGVNSAAKALSRPPLLLDRTESYIGVMIDDLTTMGTSEPYRMFTSRSEFRLKLRPDNADMRLTEKGFNAGCVSEERFQKTIEISQKVSKCVDALERDHRSLKQWGKIFNKETNNDNSKSAFKLLGLYNWNLTLHDFLQIDSMNEIKPIYDEEISKRVKTFAFYAESVLKDETRFVNMKRDRAISIPLGIDYNHEKLNISNEIREKLLAVRPVNMASAANIPGVTPAGLSTLLSFVLKMKTSINHELGRSDKG